MPARNKKTLQPVQALYKRLLPQDFFAKRAQIRQFQQFFDERKTDAIFQMVKVLNVTGEYLHVSLPNPPLANYFRLHGEEIRQQIREQFNRDLQIKISVQPQGDEHAAAQSHKPLAHYNQAVTEQISKSAEALDDDELKAALKSLSQTLQDKNRE